MVGVVILDAGGIIESCDTTIEALFGYAADDLIGRRLTMLMANPCDDMFPDALAAGDVTRGGFDCQVLGRQRDGSTFPMDLVIVALPPGDRPEFMGIVRDLSAREQQYEESLKAKKLEVIGVLAGGIAHGLNNILTGILGNISLAKTCMASPSKVMARLTAAEHACQRAADLAQQLLTFAKGGAPIRQPTSIAAIIRDAAATALAGTNVNYELVLSDSLWPVDVNARQISQPITTECFKCLHDPLQVFKDHQQRLYLTFPEEYPFESVKGTLASLWRVKLLKKAVLWQGFQQ